MPEQQGAYGLRVVGIDAPDQLGRVPAEWPAFRIERRLGRLDAPKPAGTFLAGAHSGELWLPDDGCITILRDPLGARITTNEPIGVDAVVHPYLALPAALAGRWLGRFALHGGAFVHEGLAWAVIGRREAGKSATLGALMKAGFEIVADDALVLAGQIVFAGPRTIDLRADAAKVLGGDHLGLLGSRHRWRLRPHEAQPQMPLGGVILLGWGDSIRIEQLDVEHRLTGLVSNSIFAPGPDVAELLLDLVALPAWRFVRPPGLESLDRVVELLIPALGT